MEELEQYHKRYFDAKSGEVALTCCALCGAIIWHPELHERAEHGNEDSDQGTGEESSADEDTGSENDGATTEVVTGDGDIIGEPVGVGRSTPTERPISNPPASRTGRSTAAGTGRKGRG